MKKMEFGKRRYIGQEQDELNIFKVRALWVFIILSVLYIAINVAISLSKYYYLSL